MDDPLGGLDTALDNLLASLLGKVDGTLGSVHAMLDDIAGGLPAAGELPNDEPAGDG
ncbi:hypothetical protein ACWD01_10375 [Streptomyces sp. NPDC002835]